MSRQLLFYATREDLSPIYTWLVDNKVQILHNKISNNQRTIDDKETFLRQQIVYLTLPKFNVKLKYVENFKYYYPSSVESEVIDFSFPNISEIEKTIEPARFYMQKSYYINEGLMDKSPEFIYFYEYLVKNFKKSFLKKYKGVYLNLATIEAIKFLDNGYNEKQLI